MWPFKSKTHKISISDEQKIELQKIELQEFDLKKERLEKEITEHFNNIRKLYPPGKHTSFLGQSILILDSQVSIDTYLNSSMRNYRMADTGKFFVVITWMDTQGHKQEEKIIGTLEQLKWQIKPWKMEVGRYPQNVFDDEGHPV